MIYTCNCMQHFYLCELLPGSSSRRLTSGGHSKWVENGCFVGPMTLLRDLWVKSVCYVAKKMYSEWVDVNQGNWICWDRWQRHKKVNTKKNVNNIDSPGSIGHKANWVWQFLSTTDLIKHFVGGLDARNSVALFWVAPCNKIPNVAWMCRSKIRQSYGGQLPLQSYIVRLQHGTSLWWTPRCMYVYDNDIML